MVLYHKLWGLCIELDELAFSPPFETIICKQQLSILRVR